MKKLALLIALTLSAAAHSVKLIVQMQPWGSTQSVAARYNLTLLDFTQGAPFVLFDTPAGADPEAIQTALNSDFEVLWAEDNVELTNPEHSGGGKATTIGAVNDPNAFYTLNSNYLQQVNWINPAAGPYVATVAILDTGLSPRQPALWGRVLASTNFVNPGTPAYDVPMGLNRDGDADLDEAVGHGTMVTGIVEMMAPRARIVVVKIADSEGFTDSWLLVKGIAYATVRGVRVINISLGSLERISSLSDVLDWTEAYKVQVVGAAGNNNLNERFFPAAYSEVVGVVALDEQDHKASFSNYDRDFLMSAPGTGIRSYFWDGTMAYWSGTSFAAPMVSAALAVACETYPRSMPMGFLRNDLYNTGVNIDPLNPNFERLLGRKVNFTTLYNLMRQRYNSTRAWRGGIPAGGANTWGGG